MNSLTPVEIRPLKPIAGNAVMEATGHGHRDAVVTLAGHRLEETTAAPGKGAVMKILRDNRGSPHTGTNWIPMAMKL